MKNEAETEEERRERRRHEKWGDRVSFTLSVPLDVLTRFTKFAAERGNRRNDAINALMLAWVLQTEAEQNVA